MIDPNPYRSPETAEPPPPAPRKPPTSNQRSWARMAMGVGCLCIALVLLVISLTTWGMAGNPADTQRLEAIVIWAAGSSAAFVLMGAGMLANRDWLALLGLLLFAICFSVVVVMQSMM
jgi:hypothetical protein